jgi:starch-binding outer membrane protein, SusD/RagB family
MNNILKFSKIFLLLTVMFIGFSSCEKYLTEEPTSQFTADFVYNNIDGLESGVVGLYNFQRAFWENQANNGSNPLAIDARDDLTIPRGGEIANIGRMTQGTTADNSGVFVDYWRTYYRIVDRANALIKAAENLQTTEEARRKKVIAEAKFFRAHSVFVLFRLFNNIYVTTEPTTPENALNIISNKTPENEIYALINDDLTFAIENLAWKSGVAGEFGRITKGVARHVKADVAMWQGNWAEAKLQTDSIINRPTIHNLVNSTGLVFRGDLNHAETLWALQYKALINGRPHKINFNLMPNYAELIPGSKYSIEQGGRGFGWLTINNYLRDLLLADPNDTRIKGNYYVKDYVYNDPATLPAGQVLGAKIVHPQWQEFAATAANRNFFFIRLNAGCKKYFPDDGIPTEDLQTKNIAMYRFAETLLLAAEANMRLGDNGQALIYLNRVRTRAGTAPLSSISLEAILDEQAREFAFEGRRWYWLKRTGKLYDYVVDHAGYGKPGDLRTETNPVPVPANTAADPFPYRNDARRNLRPHMVNWPIPRSEINLLGAGYPQNVGY